MSKISAIAPISKTDCLAVGIEFPLDNDWSPGAADFLRRGDVDHVAINPRQSARPLYEVIEELASEVIPALDESKGGTSRMTVTGDYPCRL